MRHLGYMKYLTQIPAGNMYIARFGQETKTENLLRFDERGGKWQYMALALI